MINLSNLTTDQKQVIVDGLTVMINKVILPASKYLASSKVVYSRDAIKIVETNDVKYQIRPVVSRTNDKDEFNVSITITAETMTNDPVSTFDHDYTSYDSVVSDLEKYKKEILA